MSTLKKNHTWFYSVLTLTSKKNTETYHRNKSNVSTFFCTLSTQKVTFIDLRVRWRLHSGTVALTYVLVAVLSGFLYSYVPLIEASITLHPVIVRWCYTGTVLCGERAGEQIKSRFDYAYSTVLLYIIIMLLARLLLAIQVPNSTIYYY